MNASKNDDNLKMFDKGGSDDPLLNINKTFYSDYDSDYFVNKAVTMSAMISEPKILTDQIYKGYSVGKITVTEGDVSEKWLQGYAKREMVINSYHAIESFFRLFFAHVEDAECPWVGVEQLQSFKQFKERISQLHRRIYFEGDHNKAVSEMLLGDRKMYSTLSDEDWDNNVSNVVQLVDRLGYDILSNQDYNVYKHGAAMLDTEFGFQIDDGKILGAKKQETFLYLSSKREETDTEIVKTFSKTYKFMRWEQRFASTYMSGQLMHNLLNLSVARLDLAEGKPLEVTSFHTYNLKQLLDGDNDGAIVMPTNVSEQMFVRTYNKVPKVKKKQKGQNEK